MLWDRTASYTLLAASCSFAFLSPPCTQMRTPGPAACRDAFGSARLLNTHLLLIFTWYFCYLSSDFFSCPLKQTANANPAVNKKKKRRESEGKHKTERQLNICQTEREKVKLQQWVAKAKSIELNNPSNTSLCLWTIWSKFSPANSMGILDFSSQIN